MEKSAESVSLKANVKTTSFSSTQKQCFRSGFLTICRGDKGPQLTFHTVTGEQSQYLVKHIQSIMPCGQNRFYIRLCGQDHRKIQLICQSEGSHTHFISVLKDQMSTSKVEGTLRKEELAVQRIRSPSASKENLFSRKLSQCESKEGVCKELIKGKSGFYGSQSISGSFTPLESPLVVRGVDENEESTKENNRPRHRLMSPVKRKSISLLSPPRKRSTSADYNSSGQQKSEPEMTGLTNLGNTCYMNAVLNIFLYSPFFEDSLLQAPIIKHVGSNSFLKSLATLIRFTRNSSLSIEAQKKLLVQIKNSVSASSHFSGNKQQDAHEFLEFCLDKLQTEAQAAITKCPVEKDTMPPVCPIRWCFESKVRRTIQCSKCSYQLNRDETFFDYSLDVTVRCNNPSLYCSLGPMFEQFFKEEPLEYSCEKCQHTRAVASHSFICLPRILVLHVKRYTYDSVTGRDCKRNDRILAPKQFSVEKLCTHKTQLPPVRAFKTTEQTSADLILLAVSERQQPQIGARGLNGGANNLGEQTSGTDEGHTLEKGMDNDRSYKGIGESRGAVLGKVAVNRCLFEKPEQHGSIRNDSKSMLMEDESKSVPLKEDDERISIKDDDDEDLHKALQLSLLEDNLANQEEEELEIALNLSRRESELSSLACEADDSADEVEIVDEVQPEMKNCGKCYQLVRVINHLGKGTTTGHYVCDVFHKDGVWRRHNDFAVQRIEWHDVVKRQARNGYIYVYLLKLDNIGSKG